MTYRKDQPDRPNGVPQGHRQHPEHWHRAEEQHESSEQRAEEGPAAVEHPEGVISYPEGMGKKPTSRNSNRKKQAAHKIDETVPKQ